MSDAKNMQNPFADDDFDWDDALAEWEAELDRVTSRPPPPRPDAAEPPAEEIAASAGTVVPPAASSPPASEAPAPTDRGRRRSLSLELDDPLGPAIPPMPPVARLTPPPQRKTQRPPAASLTAPPATEPPVTDPSPPPSLPAAPVKHATLPASPAPRTPLVTDPSPPPRMSDAHGAPTLPPDVIDAPAPSSPVSEADALVLEGFDELFASLAPGALDSPPTDPSDPLGELAPRVTTPEASDTGATQATSGESSDEWMAVDTSEVKALDTGEEKAELEPSRAIESREDADEAVDATLAELIASEPSSPVEEPSVPVASAASSSVSPATTTTSPPAPTAPQTSELDASLDEDLLAVDAFPDPDEVELSLERSGPPPPPPLPSVPLPSRPPASDPAPFIETGVATASDAGALVAKRTVRQRKPWHEHFSLVGAGPAVLAARRALLEKLADQVVGGSRGRLLCAAAALSAQLGEADRVEALYEAAREAAPKDVVALRALRKAAIGRGEWTKAAALLEEEAALPLSDEDRASSLLLLAEIQLTQLNDPAGARRSARTALGFKRESLAAALLFAEASQADGNAGDIAMALSRAAESWQDDRATAALWSILARAAEQRGQTEHAADLYRQALERSNPIEALFGHARTTRETAGNWQASASLAWIAARYAGTPLGERIARTSTQLLLHDRPHDAMVNLSRAKLRLSFETRADAARALGDSAEEARALEGWANAAGGTDRALAMVRLAELKAGSGDLLGADEALQAATLADAQLGLIRVVREVIARRSGDATRLARALSNVPGQALAAAAKLAIDPESSDRERELLVSGRTGDEAPATADVLALDLAASMQDTEEVDAGLRRQADRAPEGRKTGALLAWAGAVLERGQPDRALSLLKEARESAPDDLLVLRPLARLVIADAREDAARIWFDEARLATGPHAAFAAVYAGRLLAPRDTESMSAYEQALEAQALYPPARWAKRAVARRLGRLEVVAADSEAHAEQTSDPVKKGLLYVRAALARASTGDQTAAGTFQRALQVCPDDTVLCELLLAHEQVFPRDVLAEVLMQIAERTPVELAESAALRAAVAFEEANDPARTAEAYRNVLSRFPDNPFARRAIDRAELAAGEGARVAERRFAAVKDASSGPARALALERLAEFDLYERDDAGAAVLSYHSILEVAEGHVPSLRRLERYYMEHARNDELGQIEQQLASRVASGPDAAAHLRMAARISLGAEGASGAAADSLILKLHARAGDAPWVARRTVTAAKAAGDHDLMAQRLSVLAEQASTTQDAAALTLAACDALDRAGRHDEGLALIDRTLQAHDARELFRTPLFPDRFGQLAAEQGRRVEAADALEAAGAGARAKNHRASLWQQAADLWEQEGDSDRAIEALTAASEANVLYEGVFDRLRQKLHAQGNHVALITLIERRIGVGGDPPVLVGLFRELAELELSRGGRDRAKEALRKALTLDSENVDLLTRLADLCLEDEDWRGAAESLIRVARVRRDSSDVAEVADVFYKLGDIYDLRLPDARRAEAAFKRVVRLAPDHTDAIERLAAIHEREGNHTGTTEMLVLLIQHESDSSKLRQHRLRLASAYEQRGDLRRAEAVLEETRRDHPTDGPTVRAIADFYQRQNAGPALSMHLNRAANDFRQSLETDPAEARYWHGLIDILRWRGRQDAASVIASTAAALGTLDRDLASLVARDGSARGCWPKRIRRGPARGPRAPRPRASDATGIRSSFRGPRPLLAL